MRNNYANISIPVVIRRELALIGRSIPEYIDYSRRNITSVSTTNVFDADVGPLIIHRYQVET